MSSRLSKEDIRFSLLSHLESRGIAPGCLLYVKNSLQLKIFDGEKDELEEKIDDIANNEESNLTTMFFPKKSALMFVDAHGIRRKRGGSWDFWYELLFGEKSFFVPAHFLGKWTLNNNFEIMRVD